MYTLILKKDVYINFEKRCIFNRMEINRMEELLNDNNTKKSKRIPLPILKKNLIL